MNKRLTRYERFLISSLIPHPSSLPSLCRQNHLDVRAAVLLAAGFRGVFGDGVGLPAPDGLEAWGGNVGEVLDDVILDRERAPLRERHVRGGRPPIVGVAFCAQDSIAEPGHRL